LELVIGNTDTNPDKAVELAQSLIEQEVIAILGPANSAEADSILKANLIQQAGMVMIAPSASATHLTSIPNNNLFWRMAASDIFQAKIVADYAYNKLGKKTAGVLYVDTAYGQGLSAEFKTNYEKLGGVVQNNVKYPSLNDTDLENESFATYVEDLLQGNPELIFLITNLKDGAKITLTIKPQLSSSYKPLVFGCDANRGLDFVKNADESVVLGMLGTGPSASETDQNYKTFRDSYIARFGIPPDSSYAEHSYDSVYLVAFALAKAGEITRDALKLSLRDLSGPPGEEIGVGQFQHGLEALQAGDIDYQGASGKIDWDEKGDVTYATYGIWEIIKGATGLEITTKEIVPVQGK
jgi:branched-chain amino acid transport system substrate-binding protein